MQLDDEAKNRKPSDAKFDLRLARFLLKSGWLPKDTLQRALKAVQKLRERDSRITLDRYLVARRHLSRERLQEVFQRLQALNTRPGTAPTDEEPPVHSDRSIMSKGEGAHLSFNDCLPLRDYGSRLKRWFLIYLMVWLGGIGIFVFSAFSESQPIALLGLVVFLGSIIPYISAMIFAYRAQKILYESEVYPHGPWHIVVAALILNPWAVGFYVPLSTLLLFRRLHRKGAIQMIA